jgi:hypothetical protein
VNGMKNRMIRKISFVLAFSMISMMTACSWNTNEKNNVGTQMEKNLVTPSPVEIEGGNVNKEGDTPAIEPSATKELLIYTLNESTKEVESRAALVSQDVELTPEVIVNLVTDSLADGMINIDIDDVATQEDAVIVSFKSDSLPVTATDSTMETSILDVIAQSLVDNFKDEYPKVIFRISDKSYITKQYNYGLNDVYLDGTKTN